MSDERPIARPRPHPARDAGADPVDLVPMVPTPILAPTVPEATRLAASSQTTSQGGDESDDPMAALTGSAAQETFQLGVRISPEHYALVQRVKNETGASKRQIVENALEYAYGKRVSRS